MDQESSKTNGKYKLDEGIYEELIKGIINYNYGFTSIPILFNELTIKIYSQNSQKESPAAQGELSHTSKA